ncbi:MAG: fluoride efflux transporter CrcB [Flavobacteriaceae bacterium]|nr:fluoride efflux transporter CrcB [Bacteroidia bacterium]NNL16191.1 fluoride efflux transporter CrcB [Flavobacteriaceae bacterium]
MKQVFLVFIGGGLGSMLRFWISKIFNNPENTIPFGTLGVNILGSFLIGLFIGLAVKYSSIINTNTLLFLSTGFCGGFTTFSAFAQENYALLKAGDITNFVIYTMGSLSVGILAVVFGFFVVKYI